MSKSKKSIKEGFEKRTVHSNPEPTTRRPKPDSNIPPSRRPLSRPSDDSRQPSSSDD